jgi:hypothetical protein
MPAEDTTSLISIWKMWCRCVLYVPGFYLGLSWQGQKNPFPKRPDHLWGSPNLLFSGYWCYFLELKRTGRDIDHSTPSSAGVRNDWIYTSTPLCSFMSWKGTSYLATCSKAWNVYKCCGIWRSQIAVWEAIITKSMEQSPSLKLTVPHLRIVWAHSVVYW